MIIHYVCSETDGYTQQNITERLEKRTKNTTTKNPEKSDDDVL